MLLIKQVTVMINKMNIEILFQLHKRLLHAYPIANVMMNK